MGQPYKLFYKNLLSALPANILYIYNKLKRKPLLSYFKFLKYFTFPKVIL